MKNLVKKTMIIFSPSKVYRVSIVYNERSLTWCFPMLCTNFLNIVVGNILVNRSAKLSWINLNNGSNDFMAFAVQPKLLMTYPCDQMINQLHYNI